jgi:hypothetical protein
MLLKWNAENQKWFYAGIVPPWYRRFTQSRDIKSAHQKIQLYEAEHSFKQRIEQLDNASSQIKIYLISA